MKFTIISHACVYIEHKNTRLIIDPWLIGSCYWRSWWNYPEPDEGLIQSLKPTHIYITHLHWDHYHGPSLRLLEKYDPEVIFPKHFTKRLIGDCRKFFKFTKIREIAHGQKIELGDDFKVCSYQWNPTIIDSALVIEAGTRTILNANDCKIFGLSLRHLISNHPKIDFVFRSHSSASPLPHCIKGSLPNASSRSPTNYGKEFTFFSRKTKALYSIPFASSHYYLHPRTVKQNKYYSNPEFVKNIFDNIINGNQNCKIMPSGSIWSEEKGFEINQIDYSQFDIHINEGIKKHLNSLDAQVSIERKTILNKIAFHRYFQSFLKSLFFPFNFNFRFGFLIKEYIDDDSYLCVVDGKKKSTYIQKNSDENQYLRSSLSFVINTPINVFNDCNTKKMYNCFGASKLLEIDILDSGSEAMIFKLFTLLDFYENGCLPIYKLFNWRNINIIIIRWREFFDIIYYIIMVKVFRKNICKLYE